MQNMPRDDASSPRILFPFHADRTRIFVWTFPASFFRDKKGGVVIWIINKKSSPFFFSKIEAKLRHSQESTAANYFFVCG